MKLTNPACYNAGHCLEICGMCGLGEKSRHITKHSLFGLCRIEGECTCGLCDGLNGTRKMKKSDILVSSWEVSEFNGRYRELMSNESELRRKLEKETTKYNARLRGVYKTERQLTHA